MMVTMAKEQIAERLLRLGRIRCLVRTRVPRRRESRRLLRFPINALDSVLMLRPINPTKTPRVAMIRPMEIRHPTTANTVLDSQLATSEDEPVVPVANSRSRLFDWPLIVQAE